MKQAYLQSGGIQGVIVVFIGGMIALPCSAEITPLALLRAVDVTAGANVNSHAPPDQHLLFSSSSQGPFDETRQAQVVASGMGDTAEGIATALQQSLVQYSLIEAQAETHVSLNVNTSSGGGAFGDAVAELVFEFALNASTDYRVIAEVDRFGPVSDVSVELLLEESTSIFAIGEPTGYTENSILQSGTLSPGNYKLIGSADTILSYLGPMFPSTSGAEFSLLFTLEVLPGDFDHDGDIDGRDFLVWQRNPSVGNLADWQAQYGTPLAAATAVPEPSAGMLLAIGCALLMGRLLTPHLKS